MKTKLVELFQGKLFNLSRVKDFLKDYEAERIAGRFIKLFEELKETRERGRR